MKSVPIIHLLATTVWIYKFPTLNPLVLAGFFTGNSVKGGSKYRSTKWSKKSTEKVWALYGPYHALQSL